MKRPTLSHLTDKSLEYEIEFASLSVDKPEGWDTMSDRDKRNALDWARMEAGLNG